MPSQALGPSNGLPSNGGRPSTADRLVQRLIRQQRRGWIDLLYRGVAFLAICLCNQNRCVPPIATKPECYICLSYAARNQQKRLEAVNFCPRPPATP